MTWLESQKRDTALLNPITSGKSAALTWLEIRETKSRHQRDAQRRARTASHHDSAMPRAGTDEKAQSSSGLQRFRLSK